MGPSQSAISQWCWGFHTLSGGIDQRDLRFRSQVVRVIEIWKDFWNGECEIFVPRFGGISTWARGEISPRPGSMGPSPSSITQWSWGFHTVWGGIAPGDLRFRPGVVLVVEIWNDLRSAEGNLSFPSAAGPQRGPEGKISPRPGSMGPSQSAITQWGWGFHTLRVGIDPRDLRFRPRVFRGLEIWNYF